jgi:hypothetical protein
VSLLIYRIELHRWDVIHVAGYLHHVGKPSRLRDRFYSFLTVQHGYDYVHYLGSEVLRERNCLYWVGWRPVLVTFQQPRRSPAGQPVTTGGNNIATSSPVTEGPEIGHITFLRWTFHADELVRDAGRYTTKTINEQNTRAGRFSVSMPGNRFGCGWGRQIPGQQTRVLDEAVENKSDPMIGLVWSPEVQGLVEDAQRWRQSREWYIDRGIPWKTGWLLYGPPGTGKSALATAIARILDIPLIVMNLAGVSRGEFEEHWHYNVVSNLPAVVLFEDLDSVFDGRKNVSFPDFPAFGPSLGMMAPSDKAVPISNDANQRALSFDCLINKLDGVERHSGLFTIITVNDISRIDPALGAPSVDGQLGSTRPGRIDRAVQLGTMRPEEAARLARQILVDCPDVLDEMESKLKSGDLCGTPAQLRELCVRHALQKYWSTQKDPDV